MAETGCWCLALRKSPDGQWLAFIRAMSWSTRDLYLLPMAGGEPKRLTGREIISHDRMS